MQSGDGSCAPDTTSFVFVHSDSPVKVTLRAMHDARAMVALIPGAEKASSKMLGVINERDIAQIAYDTARMVD
jgi:hypothetical protein